MATLIVKGNNATARRFLEFARTLPYVEIIEGNDKPVKKLKPEVEASIKMSMRGEGLTECSDVDDMFKKLGY
jgi:hypothetical protein